jgi:hypothetical protein
MDGGADRQRRHAPGRGPTVTNFFPRHPIAWKLEEPAAFRKLSLSLVEMAALTGVVLRLVRVVFVSHTPSDSIVFVGGSVAFGLALLCGMATLHLGNFPLKQWFWRAPAFAVIAAVAESLTSLALIALGRERLGTTAAKYGDWPQIALDILFWRLAAVLSFALVLGLVVRLVRYAILKRENRLHTAQAVHEETLRRTAEHERAG